MVVQQKSKTFNIREGRYYYAQKYEFLVQNVPSKLTFDISNLKGELVSITLSSNPIMREKYVDVVLTDKHGKTLKMFYDLTINTIEGVLMVSYVDSLYNAIQKLKKDKSVYLLPIVSDKKRTIIPLTTYTPDFNYKLRVIHSWLTCIVNIYKVHISSLRMVDLLEADIKDDSTQYAIVPISVREGLPPTGQRYRLLLDEQECKERQLIEKAMAFHHGIVFSMPIEFNAKIKATTCIVYGN